MARKKRSSIPETCTVEGPTGPDHMGKIHRWHSLRARRVIRSDEEFLQEEAADYFCRAAAKTVEIPESNYDV